MNLLKRIIIFSCLFSYHLAAETFSLEVVAVEYPPFTTLNNKSGGIAFELLESRLANSHVTASPLFLPPARAARYLSEGPWCASFYPIRNTNDYKSFALSQEKVKIGLVRLKQQGDFAWTALEQLKGQTVALLRTSDNSTFLQEFENAGIEVAFAESPQAIVMMVLLSRVDLGLADSWSFESLEAENKAKLQFSTTSLFETPITLHVHDRCITQYQKAAETNLIN
ncbi:transporter substrate-binding domain-containing protein [Thalassotalea sp. LPB0316]|uniref:transporter substrate-binding domain-containing protein n=1 Tax=Thalassotalea sp. LPB0316 TaxID=2769490 RepID=UPI001868B4F9|nr:transporter substrate-binding domain-containing protein [Thalassotalea sp. LPB0316]QOL26332.1 transporter substrate-binding domain-containing protein [Thalassotalea sp. LPB0316]